MDILKDKRIGQALRSFRQAMRGRNKSKGGGVIAQPPAWYKGPIDAWIDSKEEYLRMRDKFLGNEKLLRIAKKAKNDHKFHAAKISYELSCLEAEQEEYNDITTIDTGIDFYENHEVHGIEEAWRTDEEESLTEESEYEYNCKRIEIEKSDEDSGKARVFKNTYDEDSDRDIMVITCNAISELGKQKKKSHTQQRTEEMAEIEEEELKGTLEKLRDVNVGQNGSLIAAPSTAFEGPEANYCTKTEFRKVTELVASERERKKKKKGIKDRKMERKKWAGVENEKRKWRMEILC